MNTDNFYSTKSVWDKERKESVCVYCRVRVRRKDTSWPGHTHRNFYEDICDCIGAKKNGVPYDKID